MKIAVLGLGSIGLRHAKNLRKLGAEVIGYDTDETKQREFQGKVVSREFALGQCDAVLSATPTLNHADDLIDTQLNRKPIFVEKPILNCCPPGAPDFSEEKIWVGYMLRFHPCIRFAADKIANGHIGEPIWASFTVSQLNTRYTDSVVLNWSHEIDLALHLFGPAKVLCASVKTEKGIDTIADFVLQHESGVRSTIHMDYVTKQEIREFWIAGSERNIGVDLVGRTSVWGRAYETHGGSWDGDYINEMSAWLNALEGRPTVLATGQEGIEVVKICEQVINYNGIDQNPLVNRS